MPVEITYSVLHHLHSMDIINLAQAVMYNRHLYNNVFLPCRSFLRPVIAAGRRRAHFETHLGPAHDFTEIYGQELWDFACTDNLDAARHQRQRVGNRRMRHEHSIAFLQLEETLHWLPPARDATDGMLDYFAELTVCDKQNLRTAAAELGLYVPSSFFKLMSDTRLMQRLPYSFWLLDRTGISSASQYISNGQGGYMIDFCHQPSCDAGSDLWSLWLEPGGSHCVIRRCVAPELADIRKKPAAQLAGTSFELWLANAFYAHWKECNVSFSSHSHQWLDRPMLDCLGRYLQYNCLV